jgi:hypothetical protein
VSLLDAAMPRRKPSDGETPAGTILAENLIRLGYADTVIRATEIANLVTKKTGKNMSRQRVANLLNAINISPETIKMIAEGLGVKPEELTRRTKR